MAQDNRDRGPGGGKLQRGGQSRGNQQRGGQGNKPPQKGGTGGQRRGGQRRRTDHVDPARFTAITVLSKVREDGAYANLVLPKELKKRKLDGRDAAFATEITYGTLRSQGLLDAVLSEASTRPLDEVDGELLDVLRLGAYQLLRTRVSPHGAVDTAVAAAQKVGHGGAKGFVNAILRRVSEKKEAEWIDIVAPKADTDPVGYLSMKYSHPRWISEAFAQSLGPAAGELSDALEADDARPQVHLVARPGEITAEELALISGGEEGPWSPYAVHLESGDPGDLEPVRSGMAAVQDEGSQLIARALTMAPVIGEDKGRWLDLCAGPGGKAALIGSVAAIDGAHVDAVEISDKRAGLISGVVEKLPVTVHVADGRSPGLEPGYDRVLVDAPCSGLGSLRRRPEARWKKSPADIPALAKLQGELLASAAELVRPGGVIVYATCSPHIRETRGTVERALRTLGLEEIDARELVAPMTDVGAGPSVQMWPHRHGTDAMFFSVLRKPVA